MRVGSLVLCVALVGGAVACGDDAAPNAAAAAELAGVDWLLATVTHDGEIQQVPAAQGVVLRFDDGGGYSLLACNHYRGRVTTDGPAMRFSREHSTNELCAGRTGVLERQVSSLTTGRVEWSVADDQLHLVGPHLEGDFVRRDPEQLSVGPDRVLLEDPGGDGRWAYRVGISGRGYATYLDVQVRPDGEGPFQTTTTLVDRTRLDVTSDPVGDGVLVAGTVKAPGTSVEYQGLPVGPFAVRTWPLANGASVFAAVVAPGGQLVVHDAQGGEVARSRPVSDGGR